MRKIACVVLALALAMSSLALDIFLVGADYPIEFREPGIMLTPTSSWQVRRR